MNKAFEKILERLDDGVSLPKMNGMERRVGKSQTQGFGIGVLFAKEIVKEVSKEYKDGWIPCSERLPEIDGNTSDIVLVCGSNGFQYMAFWCDDLNWRFCECGIAKEPVLWTEIVAWQPLPEPFKEGD